MTPLASALQPYTHTISSRFNEPCAAAILDGLDVIYIARSQADRIMTSNLGVGTRLPAFCTSLGRAILAYQDMEWLEQYWRKATFEPRTPHTLTDRKQIEAALEQVRELGFAFIDQEAEIGLRSLAVPLWGSDQRVGAALTVTASLHSKSITELKRDILPELLKVQRSVRHLNSLR
jgi:IclR family pca regulon transcriptional regulator